MSIITCTWLFHILLKSAQPVFDMYETSILPVLYVDNWTWYVQGVLPRELNWTPDKSSWENDLKFKWNNLVQDTFSPRNIAAWLASSPPEDHRHSTSQHDLGTWDEENFVNRVNIHPCSAHNTFKERIAPVLECTEQVLQPYAVGKLTSQLIALYKSKTHHVWNGKIYL